MPLWIRAVFASADNRLLGRAKAAVSADKTIRIVGEAQEAEQTVALVRRERPALLILDLDLPPEGGLAALGKVLRRNPRTKVLMIDASEDKGRVLGVTKAGASGYMLEEAIPAHLAKAIRVMAAGEAWLSRKLAAIVVEELQRLARLLERRGQPRTTA